MYHKSLNQSIAYMNIRMACKWSMLNQNTHNTIGTVDLLQLWKLLSVKFKLIFVLKVISFWRSFLNFGLHFFL